MSDQYGHHQFPEAVDRIFRETLDKLDGDERPLLWSVGHIVWEDGAYDDDGIILWCLNEAQNCNQDVTSEQVEIVRESLRRLLALPIEQRR